MKGTTTPEARRETDGISPAALGAGAVLAMGVCCAGPFLVAAGALSAIGRLVGSPAAVLMGGSGSRRRGRRAGPTASWCCHRG